MCCTFYKPAYKGYGVCTRIRMGGARASTYIHVTVSTVKKPMEQV